MTDQSAMTGGIAPRLCSQRDAARALSVGLSTIKQLIAKKEIVVVPIGRRKLVIAQSLDAYIGRLKAGVNASDQ